MKTDNYKQHNFMNKILLIVATVLLFGCSKSKDSTPPPPTPTVSGTFTFTFNVNSVSGYTKACRLITENGSTYLLMEGNSNSDNNSTVSPESTFQAKIKMPSNKIAVGTYTSSASSNNVTYSAKYAPSSYTYYTASPIYTAATITFTIVSYDNTTKFISCKFSGTLQNQTTSTIHTVTNGVIYGRIE